MPAILLLVALLASGHIESIAASCKAELEVCFSVDGSEGVCESCWESVRNFTHNVTESWKIGPNDTKVALMTFGDNIVVEWDLNGYTKKQPLLSAIDNVTCSGGELKQTGIVRVLLSQIFTTANGSRTGVRKVAVLTTNGAPSISLEAAEAASTALQQNNITVLVVCYPPCTEDFARRLSSPPKQNNETYFLVTDCLLLDGFVDIVRKKICGSKG